MMSTRKQASNIVYNYMEKSDSALWGLGSTLAPVGSTKIFRCFSLYLSLYLHYPILSHLTYPFGNSEKLKKIKYHQKHSK